MSVRFLIGLVAGCLNSPHCLGMCGGFALHLAKSSPKRPIIQQFLFVAGKSFTYVFLGALAASMGTILFKNTALAQGAPFVSLFVGLLIVVFGTHMLGLRLPQIRALRPIADARLVHGLFDRLFVAPPPIAAFVLGLGTGFLPCPLPMGMLALAATSHNVGQGMALMAGVGLGTAPALLGLGLFGVGLDRRFAKVGMRAAGIAVMVAGFMMVARVTVAIHRSYSAGRPAETHIGRVVAPPPTRDIPPCCCAGADH